MKRESIPKIRFIDSEYNELFKLHHGLSIKVTDMNDNTLIFVCKYIDDYHFYLGKRVYHICEFAEWVGRNGLIVEKAENYKLLAYGDSNWNYYKSKGTVYAIAKYNTGADNCIYSDVELFIQRFNESKESYELTDYGKEVLNSYTECKKATQCWKCVKSSGGCEIMQ